MLLLRPWKWQTTLDCEMLTLLDTLQVLLTKFVLIAESTTTESSFRLTWPCLIIKVLCNQSQISWTIWLLSSDQPLHKYFGLLPLCYGSVWTHKAEVPKLVYIVQHSNHTQSETMYNVSVHQLPQYYQPQWVLFMASCDIHTVN